MRIEKITFDTNRWALRQLIFIFTLSSFYSLHGAEEKKNNKSWDWNIGFNASKTDAEAIWAHDYEGGNWDDSNNWAKRTMPSRELKALISTKATTARVVIDTTSFTGPYQSRILHLGALQPGLTLSASKGDTKLGSFSFKLIGTGNLDITKGGQLEVGELSVSRERASLGQLLVFGPDSTLWAETFNIGFGEGGDPVSVETPFGDLGDVYRGVMGVFHSAISLFDQKVGQPGSAESQEAIDQKFAEVDRFISGNVNELLTLFYDSGKGYVNILGGGTIFSKQATLGTNGWGIGQVTVSGENSLWDNSAGPLVIGLSGVGIVDVIKGGRLLSGPNSIVGGALRGVGTVGVSGAGSLWSNNGTIVIGDRGNGSLILSEGGGAPVQSMKRCSNPSFSAFPAAARGRSNSAIKAQPGVWKSRRFASAMGRGGSSSITTKRPITSPPSRSTSTIAIFRSSISATGKRSLTKASSTAGGAFWSRAAPSSLVGLRARIHRIRSASHWKTPARKVSG